MFDQDETKCRVCGCTEFNACYDEPYGACYWIEEDLCSACATEEQRSEYNEEMNKNVNEIMKILRRKKTKR